MCVCVCVAGGAGGEGGVGGLLPLPATAVGRDEMDALEAAKSHKARLDRGIATFNANPVKGMRLLISRCAWLRAAPLRAVPTCCMA